MLRKMKKKKVHHVPKEALLYIQLSINRGLYLRVTAKCFEISHLTFRNQRMQFASSILSFITQEPFIG